MSLRGNLALARMIGQGGYYTGVVLRDRAQLCPALLLERLAQKIPDATAILFEERRYNYRDFNRAANRVASVLKERGLEQGDCVALLMDNRPEYLFTVMGANKIGVVTSLVNSHVMGEQLVHALKICSPKLIIVGDEFLPSVTEVATKLPVPMDAVLVWSEATSVVLPKGARDMNALFRSGRETNPSSTKKQRTRAPMLYMYTSGTTGLPKAAVVKNQRFLRIAMVFGRVVLRLSSGDVTYVALPLYHATGAIGAWGAVLATGSALALRRKFSASAFWDDCVKYRATVFPYIGELCRYLLQAPMSVNERRHSVHTIIGAGMRRDVWAPFTERFGIERVIEFYGSTEGNVAMINLEGKPGMMGKLLLGQKVIRVDPETEELVKDSRGHHVLAEAGEQGVLVGRIDRLNKFDGYLDRDKTNDKILVNPFGDGKRYFNSGDLVELHEDGYVSFADRLGDTFRWKGENVSTTEVSIALNKAYGVLESNVYGVSVPKCEGRAGMAALVVNSEFTPAALAGYVVDNLPAYARPCFVRLTPSLATTGSFKHLKTQLKKEGFDPSVVREPLYVLRAETRSYEPLTPALYAKIQRGEMPL